MLSRRDAITLVAAGTALAASRPASACERDEPTKDMWGARLQEFFRSGDISLVKGHLSPNVTLITFEAYYLGTDKIAYSGAVEVKAALMALRRYLVGNSRSGPKILKSARLSGSGVEMGTNKITPIFGIEEVLTTSCGPTTLENGIDLFYQSTGVEPGGQRLPPLERFAVLPVHSSEPYPF